MKSAIVSLLVAIVVVSPVLAMTAKEARTAAESVVRTSAHSVVTTKISDAVNAGRGGVFIGLVAQPRGVILELISELQGQGYGIMRMSPKAIYVYW